jgi:hypothetical protein
VYGVLIVGEARERHPLVPVRKLATSLAIVGTIATVVGSAAFSALTQSFALTLLRIGELDPRGTGLAFWPEFLTAIAAGYVFGRAVTTKWVVLVGGAGLVFIALAAALARAVAPVDAGQVGWLCLIGGFGAGLSVSPGLFVVHTIGSQAQHHLRALEPSIAPPVTENAVRAFVTGRTVPPGVPVDALKRALALGIGDAYVIVLVLALAGIAAIAAVLIAARVRLRAPDLKKFDEGRPALEVHDVHA